MDAAGAVDAKRAPTAPWKITERFSTSAHRRTLYFSEGDISNELTQGTFLTSFDTVLRRPLTFQRRGSKLRRSRRHCTRTNV